MNANDLATQHCQPRKGKEHALDATQVAGLLRQLPGWQLRDHGMAIVKEERMHGNKLKQILCDQQTGKIIERVVDIE